MRWCLLILAGCAPHYTWVEEEPEPPQSSAAEEEERPSVNTGPCAGSTPAVRQQARQGRYSGVEGFDSRGCVGPEPWGER